MYVTPEEDLPVILFWQRQDFIRNIEGNASVGEAEGSAILHLYTPSQQHETTKSYLQSHEREYQRLTASPVLCILTKPIEALCTY